MAISVGRVCAYLVGVSENIWNVIHENDIPHQETKQSRECRSLSMNAYIEQKQKLIRT